MNNRKQTVLITGAYGSIGMDLARGFLAEGANLVLNGRNSEKLEAAAKELNCPDAIALVVGDIAEASTGRAMVAKAIERFGTVDVLVNNAGIFYAKPFIESSNSDLDTLLSTNLKGSYFTAQAAAIQMISQKEGGAIINIGTVLVDHAMTGFPASAAIVSKGAVHAMTIALAAELAPHNIRVNLVAPGIIRTALHAGANVDDYAGIHPLNRLGEVNEITDAVIHLANASYSTGVIYAVDGGYTVGR